MLVLAKSYSVAKAALVPTVVVGDHALVEANSKLQVLSGLAAFGAGLPGALAAVAVLARRGGARAARWCSGRRRSRPCGSRSPPSPPSPRTRPNAPSCAAPACSSAASAMGTLRWIVGFVTFLLAFALRGEATVAELGVDRRARRGRAGRTGRPGGRRAGDGATGVALRRDRRAHRDRRARRRRHRPDGAPPHRGGVPAARGRRARRPRRRSAGCCSTDSPARRCSRSASRWPRRRASRRSTPWCSAMRPTPTVVVPSPASSRGSR